MDKLDKHKLLFENWQKSKSPEDLGKIFDEVENTIQYNVDKYGNPNIGRNNVLIEAKKIVFNALPSYDPYKFNTNLNTFADQQLRGLKRFSSEFSNIGHVPEKRLGMVKKYKDTKERLRDDLGYEPNAAQIADKMFIPMAEVERLEKEMSGEVVGSSSTFENPTQKYDRDRDTLNMIYFNLTNKQKSVFEYMHGMNGKPLVKSNAEIAKLTGMKAPSVSRMKKAIARQVEKYQ